MYALNGQLINIRWLIFGDNQFVSKHTFHIQNPSIYLFQLDVNNATLAHMLNWYEICLNRTNYPVFNMQDFRYWLYTSFLFCVGHMVSQHCNAFPITVLYINVHILCFYIAGKCKRCKLSRRKINLKKYCRRDFGKCGCFIAYS